MLYNQYKILKGLFVLNGSNMEIPFTPLDKVDSISSLSEMLRPSVFDRCLAQNLTCNPLERVP